MTKPTKQAPDMIRQPDRHVRAVRTRLLDWYDAERRDLPWRHTLDPWAILVSEFMLQQTQVATALPYYKRFIKRFPDPGSLARAREESVLREWAGLGYYGRARNLQQTARKIIEDYDGRVPPDMADLLFLPGVGRYVAGAVASIAFARIVPAVDGNVVRVLSRLYALTEDPASTRVRRGIEELAGRLVSPERPGDFNQAMMELGALICTPRAPECPRCPLRTLCRARKEGDPEKHPPPRKRPRNVEVEEACAVVRDGEEYMVVFEKTRAGRKRPMFAFPSVELEPGDDPPARLADRLAAEYGIQVDIVDEWAEIRHQVTHHKIRKRVFRCRLAGERGEIEPGKEESDSTRWLSLDTLARMPMGAPHKKILKLLDDSQDLFGGW